MDDDGLADFSSIQEATNSPLVADGDIIYVYNGTYDEQLVVNKTILLTGESKNATILGDIRITSNKTTIQGFSIRGGVCLGSFLTHVYNVTIQENALLNGGIYTGSMPFPPVPFCNNTITLNSITNATYGIRVELGDYKIIGNKLTGCSVGIRVGSNTTLLDNACIAQRNCDESRRSQQLTLDRHRHGTPNNNAKPTGEKQQPKNLQS